MIIRRIIHRTAHLVLPICRYDAEQLLPSDAIHVVYNFIDFGQFDHRIDGIPMRAALDIPAEAPVVLMLGGVNPIKGTREFVQAALEVLERYPEAMFLVAGPLPDDGFRNRLNGHRVYRESVLRMLPKAQKQIRFLGVRSDIPELLAACDVLCFPSTVPHFARPVIEASAMGRAVIASDLGGPRELVRHEETGYLVPPQDPPALAGAIRKLISDPALRERMGANGRALAQENFDAQKNTHRVLQLYGALFPAENAS